jgi:hypothetical protein
MGAPQVSTGLTVTLGTSAWTAEIVNATPPNLTREALQTSHMGTTGYHTHCPAKLIEGGELSLVVHFDPANLPPIDGDKETITITYMDGETWVFEGFCTGIAPAADLETIMTATVTFKVADDLAAAAAP